MNDSAPRFDKPLLARAFGEAAGQYDRFATLQWQAATTLLDQLGQGPLPEAGVAMDLGCGTGRFTAQLARELEYQWLALDFSPGMARHARQHHPAVVVGDVEQLPLADSSCQMLFSSFVFQWCDWGQVIREAARVLRPGGLLAACFPVAGSLEELQQAWQQVDAQVHVNRFEQLERFCVLSETAGFTVEYRQQELLQAWYPEGVSLMRAIKAIGAHNVNHQRSRGLMGKKKFQQVLAALERFREPSGIPLSYQVGYCIIRRS